MMNRRAKAPRVIKGRDFRLTDVHGQLVTGLWHKHASVGHGPVKKR